jgi:uncharacterized repeat protein (TIGR01451 family)
MRLNPRFMATSAAILAALSMGACSMERTTEPSTRPGAMGMPESKAPSVHMHGTDWPRQRGGDNESWSWSAYPTGDPATSVLGVEKGFPNQVRAKQPFDYQIVVTNLTSQPLENVLLTEDLSDGLSVSKSTPEGRAQQGALSWSIGTLAPRESKTVRVSAMAEREGTVGTCAWVTYERMVCASVPVVAPQLRLTKTGPAEALACDEIVYTYEVTNPGSGSIGNVMIRDPLAQGLTTASGKRSVDIQVGALESGQSRKFSAKIAAASAGTFESKASAEGDGLTASSDAVKTTIRKPVLKIAQECPQNLYIGRPLEYRVTVTNTGDGEAREVVIEETLPTGATFGSATMSGRLVGSAVRWNLGALAPGASKTVTATATATAAGSFQAMATAKAYCADTVSAGCPTTVQGIPAILLEVIDVSDPIEVGKTETYVITVTNQGSAPDTNIRIVATLDDQEFVSSSGTTRGAAQANQVVFEPVASLAPGKQATFQLVVRCLKAKDVRIKFSMTSDQLTSPVEETEATRVY